MATYPSLCSTCVTYGTPCHARGHQVLLGECKHMQEKRKIENYINEGLESSESDNDSNNETESDIDNDE